ncbi:hypothetical protein [Actinomadura harenae]|uniref:Mce-associated membrane protein n=1 Tax=Actinomadura harenae TaxID=2483351 RepID=A0A3M2MAQ4_9ACTN|nr:hypothetical protein [Actinomadura harenae]RMI46572.1 hypothetical protein EBO15_06490 [Actinomadura harenae]
MTAKTTNPGNDEAADEAASSEAEVVAKDDHEAGEAKLRTAPAKRKRRVRVIEVIEDDDDLDEVLEAIESGELLDEQSEAKPQPKAEKPKPHPRPKPLLVEDEPEEEKAAEPEAKAAAQAPPDGGGPVLESAWGGFRMNRRSAVATVVTIALMASLGVWQWTTASNLSGQKQERADVEKVAAAYGDAVFTYNASNYQGQMAKVQKLLAGDLLDLYKRCTLPNLGENFKSNPNLALTSRTSRVFVGDVDGRFATAAVATDITVQSSQGTTSAPASLIRLSLAKSGGSWKVTQQFASGVNQQSNDCSGSSQIPVSPGGQNGQTGNGGKPSSTPSAKPTN